MTTNPDSFFALIERTNVALFAQWRTDSDFDLSNPQWIGTVAEWWLSNPLFNLEQVRTMVADLYGTREHVKIGGGSQARFTLIKQA